jgi:hypothetical protein
MRIGGSDEYYLTAYESALEFIESLDHTKLKISADEFKKLCSERVEGIKYDEYVINRIILIEDQRLGPGGRIILIRCLLEPYQLANAQNEVAGSAEESQVLLAAQVQVKIRE